MVDGRWSWRGWRHLIRCGAMQNGTHARMDDAVHNGGIHGTREVGVAAVRRDAREGSERNVKKTHTFITMDEDAITFYV